MPAQAVDTRQLIEEYIEALSSQPKTPELIDRYVTDPVLKQHILGTETAFPGYAFLPHQVVAEGDTAAVRATFRGTHTGPFAGVPPTGRQVEAGVMLFYRVADGRIAEHWMQLDVAGLMAQLTA